MTSVFGRFAIFAAFASAVLASGMASVSAQELLLHVPSNTTTSLTTTSEPPFVSRAKAGRKESAARIVPGGKFYVEFRSRTALSYGHTFLVHGQLSGNKLATFQVAGLHPAGEDPSNWVMGHFVPVRSETGASDGDTEDEYISARYRVVMNAEQYQEVRNYIYRLQNSSPVWHAVWYNCNAFVGDVARFMGLRAPGSTMLMPAEYINGLRSVNGGQATVTSISGLPQGNLQQPN
jgi:hypothetical protein